MRRRPVRRETITADFGAAIRGDTGVESGRDENVRVNVVIRRSITNFLRRQGAQGTATQGNLCRGRGESNCVIDGTI